MLFARSCRANQIDQKFFRIMPDLKRDEEFKMNKYIVLIEVSLVIVQIFSKGEMRVKFQ